MDVSQVDKSVTARLIIRNMTFGEELRAVRKKQGLTADAVAKSCGTSRSYITLIENGKRLPGKKVIPKIAIALQIKTETVLNWYLQDIAQKIKEGIAFTQED